MSTDLVGHAEREELRNSAFSAFGHDWPAAARAWDAYRARYPDEPDGYIFGTLALRESGQLAEAQALADAAIATHAHQPRLFLERALICFFTRDWPEARRRFADFRRRFPHEREGTTRGAEIALNMGNHAEALELTEAAVRQSPDDKELLEHYAELAERLAAPARAAAAWAQHRARYGEVRAFLGEARALAACARIPAADALLHQGLALFPEATALAAEAARMSVRQADWPEAVRRWTALRALPDFATEAASRLRDAERLMARPPDRPDLAGRVIGPDLASLLSRVWTLQFETGQILSQNMRLGRRGELLNHYGHARSWELRDGCLCLLDEHDYVTTKLTNIELGADGALRLSGRDWIHPAAPSVIVLEEQRPSIGTILNDFESLGDNCEFGIVQRFYGIEPIGLLRFNWVEYDHLLAGLIDNFPALDRPDCVRITRVGDGELVGEVDAYRYRYHTHRYGLDVDIARFERSEAVRLRYLADLLLEGIADGRKIYVRKGETADGIDRIRRLHDAMKRIGDCVLLWVVQADAAHPPGTVADLGGGLLRGAIDRFAPAEAAAHAMFDSWATICIRAHQIARPEAWACARP